MELLLVLLQQIQTDDHVTTGYVEAGYIRTKFTSLLRNVFLRTALQENMYFVGAIQKKNLCTPECEDPTARHSNK